MYFENLKKFIEDFNDHANMSKPADEAFFKSFELDMARAFMLDFPDTAIKVSKIILALNNIGDIKIRLE